MKAILKPLVIYVVIQFVAVILCALVAAIGAIIIPGAEVLDYVITGVSMGMLLATLLAGGYYYHNNYIDMSPAHLAPPVGKMWILLTGLTVSSIWILDFVMSFIPIPDDSLDIFSELLRSPVAMIAIGLVVPIFEEILFRGIIQRQLHKQFSPLKAIGISALIFGIIHANIYQLIFATLFGIIIGIIYYKTSSLIPGIILHAVNNSVAVLMYVAYPGVETFSELFDKQTDYYILLLFSLIVFYLCANEMLKIPTPPGWSAERENITAVTEEEPTDTKTDLPDSE